MKISKKVAVYVVLIIVTIFFLFPIYMLVITSMKSLQEVNTTSSWSFPTHFDFSGFVTAWNGISQGFVNSFEFTIPAVIFSILLGSLGGFALTKLKFKGSNVIFMFLLFGMFLSYQVVLIPLVKFMAALGLYGNIWSLIITNTAYGIPITTLIFRNFYSSIPTSLIEASQVDGANTFQIYSRIIIPLSIPGIVVASIWQFTNIWNNFLFGLILGSMPNIRPVTVMLNNLNGAMMAQWNTLMAGALITAIPTLIVYLVAGKYFVKGLLGGAVKG